MPGKTKKPRIGLDLDGVVCDWHRQALTLLNKRRMYTAQGLIRADNPKLFDLDFESPYWNWIKDNCTQGEWGWLWSEAMMISYREATPYPGAKDFCRFIRAMGDVVILTSRPEGSWTATIEWWREHMRYTPAAYNFFRDGMDKGLVGCDIYIEDNLNYAGAIIDAQHKPVLLFDRQWNKRWDDGTPSTDGRLLTRVKGYADVVREITKLSI